MSSTRSSRACNKLGLAPRPTTLTIFSSKETPRTSCLRGSKPKATILHVLGDSWKLRFEKTRDPQDLDKSISYHHDAVLLQGDDNILPMGLCMLAEALKARAEFNGDATDLDEALGHLYTALSVHLPDHPQCAYNLGAVAKVFQARYGLSNDADDLDQAIEYYTAAAEHTASHLRLRSLAAGEWVNFAHACGHRSALTGYQTALDLLQDTLALDPMLELQHRFIRSAPHLQALPCDAMASALQFGEVGMAVRMLEQGRGALWTELRGLRSPLRDLQDAQPALAERLLANREKLEVLSTAPEHAMVSDVQASTSVGYDNIRYHNRLLLEEQESVLAEIRSLPAFANFRTGENPAINLNEVAAEGPVIVVNLSAKRSDVVILVSNQPPACLRLPDTFLDDVTALVAHLQTGRERSYKQFNKALRHVLRETWDLIGAPVVKKLKELQVAKGSRIWWCPTGILCLLPIHAAGPISPGSSRHLLDLYVSSYTPTLTALVDARKDAPEPSSQPSTLPKMLIVAQPDPTLPTVELEVATIASLAEDVTCLLSSDATKSAVTASLPSHPWVHFACHGNIQPSRPFSSSFLLAHAEHLTLLDITRIKASSRELAFLSACHSAGAPDDSAHNEALQLSTAMQFCGYRSVVGTMWAMVARTFYENMLSREEGMREFGFRRSARAICEAAKQLRRQKVDLERWVNFIHIGA
ncbi:CHAT domain-containing protein [Amylostereum chailletii]|nr:CHAT domain-containing protein [Amylostereum chailletii]